MITIYDKNATVFTGNGIGVLWPESCVVTEEANGQYDLELIHPMTDDLRYYLIEVERILRVPSPKPGTLGSYQLYRIYSAEKDTGTLKMHVHARHIFYDLLWHVLRSCDVTNLTMSAALASVEAQAQPSNGFTFYTDATRKVAVDCSMMNVVEALIDPDMGLCNQGKPRLELVRDNLSVSLLEDGGITRNDPIMHGRNLLGANAEVSYDKVYNRIVPVGQNEDGTRLYLDSPYYVDSPDIASGDIIRVKPIEYNDIKVGSEDENEVAYTAETARAALIVKALAEFTGGMDKPEYNLDVDFILLGDTEEYAAYSALDRVYMWDSVQIIDSLHSIVVTADVTGYKYDALTGRYTNMTLGATSGERGIRLISGYQIRQNSIPGVKLIHQTLGPGQIGPGYMQQVAENATGQQFIIEFTSGVILDEANTSTIGTLKVYHNGIDISSLIPAGAVHWQRMSDDTAGDAIWNADPAHQGTKTVAINAADIDWRGVLRCSIDEVRLYSVPSMVDGELIMTDNGSGDSALFSVVDGELIYTGDIAYIAEDGSLLIPMTIGAIVLDTQLSNLKTSYINITRQGIKVYGAGFVNIDSGGEMNINAEGHFNLRAGSGSDGMGMSNDHVDDWFLWAGAEAPASAPFRVRMDGRVYATNLQQIYSQSFWDMADEVVPATFEVYIPAGYTMDSVAFTFKTGKARTFAKSAAAGGAQTSSSGGAQTSGNGGSASITSSANDQVNTGDSGTQASDGPNFSATGGGGEHYHAIGNHRHSIIESCPAPANTGYTQPTCDTQNDHTHSLQAHTHILGAHVHSLNAHKHTVSISNHTHSVADHTHAVVDHTHGLDYGINEKAALATSCVLKIGATTIGTYSPDPASLLEIKAYLVAGWNTITVQPDDDARITAYAMVKVTAN